MHHPLPAAVAFDLDGLLFNTEEIYPDVGAEILRRRGKRFGPELFQQMMGRPARVAYQIMVDHCGLSDDPGDLAREASQIFARLIDDRVALMPGVCELLEALEERSLPRAVATSSSRRFACQLLERFELIERFAFVLGGDDVTHGKPHPEVYLAAAARFGVVPGQMLVLEDSLNGLQAAVAAGTFAVAVPGPLAKHLDFTAARLVVESLADPRLYAALGLDRRPGRDQDRG
jgi:HAD superfamily hydrolase (TIGR01509 family)